MSHIRTPARLFLAASACAMLSACGTLGFGETSSEQDRVARAVRNAPANGVNSYLWRATLETLDFMPLSQVDPFGGVIITDWFADPAAPNERIRATAYILDTNLRADALKVSVFKQVRDGSGWNDSAVDADTARQVENAILTRARELYINTVDS